MREFDELMLARVIDACGGVDGRVKLQKIVYLLKAMGYELPFNDFWIRQYGPFSRGVAYSVDLLASVGAIDEKQTEFEGGEEGRRYSYHVRDSFRHVLARFEVPAPPGMPKLEEVAASLRGADRGPLEVAATKVYLERRTGWPANRYRRS